MNFKLVYGKSGTGKTAYIYNNIKTLLDNNEKVFLIVPEQSNLMAEKNLLEYTQKNALINAEVLTLSRMAERVFEEQDISVSNNISKIGKSMLLYSIISKNKSKLNFLGKSSKNADTAVQIITELKKHNITIENLENLEYSNDYQALKFKDIQILYSEYNKRIENKLLDENDNLNLLAVHLENSHLLDNVNVFIDDFDGFTPQEFEVFGKILDKSKSVTLTSSTCDINTLTNPDDDIFYFNKLFALKAIDIAEKKGHNIEKIELDKNYRAKTKELEFLEKALSQNESIIYSDDCKNISLNLVNDNYQELEEIANKIIYLVRNEDYKYSDISVITDNIEKYSQDAKAIFNQYEIPVFIDEKKKLNQNILIQFILSVFDIFSKNWSYDSMFCYLKSDLLNIDIELLNRFENYCRKWGIKGRKWQEEFKYEAVNESQNELELLRKAVIEPLNTFKNSTSDTKNVNQMCKSLYEFLIQNEIDKNLNSKLQKIGKPELADEYNTSFEILKNILDEMALVFGDEQISFERFKELLQIGLEKAELGKLPATQDQVILGDSLRSKNQNIRALFIVGLNDGSFPKASREEGFINDSDRAFLRESGFSVAKDSMELLYDERYNIYNTFTIPQEKLFLYYTSTDSDGNTLRPSITIKRIKRIFPKLEEKSKILQDDVLAVNENTAYQNALLKYREFILGKEIEEEWVNLICHFYKQNPVKFESLANGMNYTNMAEDLSDENIKKLYGKSLKTSVSRLEKYRECPFSFHMTYGLKLKEREDLKVELVDTGSFMHDVIDEFFKETEKQNISVREADLEELLEIARKIIDEKLNTSRFYMLTSTPRFTTLTHKLKRTVLDSIKYIINSIKISNFDVYGTEISFDEKSRIKSYVLELENGEKVEVTGKIDRADIGKIDDNKYVRIIDYKSSSKRIDTGLVEAGLQLQLITYLDVLSEAEKFDPAGVLYFGLKEELARIKDTTISTEELEAEIRKKFKMNGLLVADVKLIRAMDTSIPENGGASEIIPARISKENSIIEKQSQTASKEDFSKLQETVKCLIKDISKEILDGKISIKPYKYNQKTGCDYCKFKTICMFDINTKNNEYNFIKKRS